ncbi:MAG: acetate--CoA ligase family protein [Thiolinea sp.]
MADLSRFLNPQSIAYVGGSQVAGAIRASQRAAYRGRLYVINSTRAEVAGVPCHPSLAALPEVPDAVLIGLSPQRSIAAVAEAAAAGCGGAVVMSAGFAELRHEDGRALQQALVMAAGAMPLLGPNCMGLLNCFSGAAIWADDNHIERQDGPAAALISQSGALMIGITGVEQALPLGYVISLGNQAVTSMAELIEALLPDSRIRAIGLYLEGINDAETLGQACRKALLQGVPVVALKGGDQAGGAEVALSHTASMVVERDLWEAFCRRFGVVEVSSPKALTETLKLLAIAGLPAGKRLSVSSYSGGLNGLVAARCVALGLPLPPPTAANAHTLRDSLPDTVAVHNPLDMNIPYRDSRGGISMQDTTGIAAALIALAQDVADQLVFFIDIPRADQAGLDTIWRDSMLALPEVRASLGIPVVVAGIMPEGLPVDFRLQMQAQGVAALCGYTDALEALAASARLAANRQTLLQQAAPAGLLRLPAHPPDEQLKTSLLDEASAKQALQAYGLQTPAFQAVPVANAQAAADQLGYPLAVKVLSERIAHKARVGGVKLNLHSAEQVRQAVQQIMTEVAAAAGGHEVTHVLLERMVSQADREIMIGIKRHPAMGLAMLIGLGGSQAEQMARFTTCLLPLTDEELQQALHDLGLQAHPAAAAVQQACRAIEQYAVQQAGPLLTLDVNPLLLTADGQAWAVDALIILTAGDNDRGGRTCLMW